ncbi:MAG: aldo/keto reductase [Woeseiaceae bacterium]
MSVVTASRLAYGCMRIANDRDKGKRAILAAVDAGYTLFDHADIYGGGQCEQLFGEVLRESPGLRDRILIQGKCGIRLAGDGAPQRYDFSRDHLVSSVEGILQRLGTERLDYLLLHRPDYLMNAEEVAEVFASLESSGKVAQFGVSNFSATQFALLQSACDKPLVANQVEINLHNVDALHNGVLDQCQRLGVTPQAWCPLAVVAYEAWGNTFSNDDEARIRQELDRQSQVYGVEPWIVVLAWLLKHPAGISPIIGSTTPERIAAANEALDVNYSREDWYRLLEARNGESVP